MSCSYTWVDFQSAQYLISTNYQSREMEDWKQNKQSWNISYSFPCNTKILQLILSKIQQICSSWKISLSQVSWLTLLDPPKSFNDLEAQIQAKVEFILFHTLIAYHLINIIKVAWKSEREWTHPITAFLVNESLAESFYPKCPFASQ